MDDSILGPRDHLAPFFPPGSPEVSGFPVAMLHYVARPPIRRGLRGLFFSPGAFRDFIHQMRTAGVDTAFPEDFRQPAETGKRQLCLTFDDGASDLLETVLPILLEAGYTATAFIVAGKMGHWNDWDRGVGARVRLADEGQIREWIRSGQKIGAHTMTHPHLTQLSAENAAAEIVESKSTLEDRFGVEVKDFCYPYGDFDARTRELVQEAGFETACSTIPGENLPEDDAFALKRRAITHRRPWVAAIAPAPLARWC